jgi:hypothetical protein
MLFQRDDETLVAGGLGQGNAFTIAASAKAFDILSSNLYQNKILAVIREISCNAADAHQLVGRPLREIKVHLPIFSEPYFAVRDFGPGLSKDDVLHLYTTYFQSNKDSNNDLIGGFGLGSKSPFAVADQFTVTSWHDGTKRSYVCYKLNGVPAINVISEEPSSDPTGLEVRVASDARPSTWLSEAESYYQWWPELPLCNLALSVKNVFAKDSVVVASSELTPNGTPAWVLTRGFSSPKVFMGLVGYDLNLSAIPNLPDEVTSALASVGVVFNLNVGDASINPSRETLSYDPATCALLTTKLKVLYASLTKDLTAALDQQPTLYDARKYLFDDGRSVAGSATSLHSIVKNLLASGRISLRWRGQVVAKQVSFDGNSFGPDTVSITRYSKYGYRTRWDTTHYSASSWQDRLHDNVRYFWSASVTAKTYATLKHYQTLGTAREATYCILSGTTLQTINDTFTKLGLPPVVDVATLPAPPRAVPGSRSSSPTARAYLFAGNGWDRSETMIDLKGGGYYCPFYDGRPKNTPFTARLNWLTEAGFLPKDTRLVGFQERRLQSDRFIKALGAAGWQPYDYDALLAAVPPATIENFQYQIGLAVLSYGREIVTPVVSMLAHPTAVSITNPAFVALRNQWLARTNGINLVYGATFNWADPAQTAAQQAGQQRVAAFVSAVTTAVATKPMLRYVRAPDTDRNTYMSDVINYINS